MLSFEFGLFDYIHAISQKWMTPFLLYDEDDNGLSLPFDLSHFDEIDQPPEVHILYPRPTSSSSHFFNLVQHKNHLINFLLITMIHLLTSSIQL